VFNIFKKKEPKNQRPIHTDFHSHLLPDLDDGVESYDESIEIIQGLSDLGYNKIITTPHVMSDFYNNSSKDILDKCDELKSILLTKNISVEIEAAAEYYLDEQLLDAVDKPERLLTFGGNYLLFETSFMNKPMYINEFIFKAKSQGYNPILAHPERYAYLQKDDEAIEDLINRGVLLQININSISGYYSKMVKNTTQKLIDNKQVHFLGSDCHNLNHLNVLKKSISEYYYKKALTLPLKNNDL